MHESNYASSKQSLMLSNHSYFIHIYFELVMMDAKISLFLPNNSLFNLIKEDYCLTQL